VIFIYIHLRIYYGVIVNTATTMSSDPRQPPSRPGFIQAAHYAVAAAGLWAAEAGLRLARNFVYWGSIADINFDDDDESTMAMDESTSTIATRRGARNRSTYYSDEETLVNSDDDDADGDAGDDDPSDHENDAGDDSVLEGEDFEDPSRDGNHNTTATTSTSNHNRPRAGSADRNTSDGDRDNEEGGPESDEIESQSSNGSDDDADGCRWGCYTQWDDEDLWEPEWPDDEGPYWRYRGDLFFREIEMHRRRAWDERIRSGYDDRQEEEPRPPQAGSSTSSSTDKKEEDINKAKAGAKSEWEKANKTVELCERLAKTYHLLFQNRHYVQGCEESVKESQMAIERYQSRLSQDCAACDYSSSKDCVCRQRLKEVTRAIQQREWWLKENGEEILEAMETAKDEKEVIKKLVASLEKLGVFFDFFPSDLDQPWLG